VVSELRQASVAPARGRHAKNAQRSRRPVLRSVRSNLYPVALYVAVNAAILLSVGLLSPAQRRAFSEVHGDSTIYLWIAKSGYTMSRCPSGPPYPHGAWCGNAGWQPLYPWLIKALAVTGLPQTAAAMVITEVCALGVFLFLWQMTRGATYPKTVLLTAAVFPGIVFLFTIYPIALLLLLALWLMKLLSERSYAWALLPAFLLPLTYSAAFLVVAAVGLWWLVFQRLEDWRQGAAVLGASVLGYVAFLGVMQNAVGRWNAELLTQAKYGNGVHNPVGTLVSLVTSTQPAAGTLQTDRTGLVPLQTLLVVFMIVLVSCIVYARRSKLTKLDQLVACWTYVFWVAPLVIGTGLASYRGNALLLPAVVLFRYLSRPLLVVLVVLSAPVAWVLATQVLTGQLL
jgi:hypothetical protein